MYRGLARPKLFFVYDSRNDETKRGGGGNKKKRGKKEKKINIITPRSGLGGYTRHTHPLGSGGGVRDDFQKGPAADGIFTVYGRLNRGRKKKKNREYRKKKTIVMKTTKNEKNTRFYL